MGLALDEPRDGDERYEIDDISLAIDPFAMKVIKQYGGVSIRSTVFGPAAELQGMQAGGCGS
ncbi:MAG: hypothetical protein AB1733_08230 [Thermodesulfobacteriota bacterium]